MLEKNATICALILCYLVHLLQTVGGSSVVTSSYSLLSDSTQEKCQHTSLTEKNAAASIVLTGTVHNCNQDSKLSYSCNLQVWRVMKGSDSITYDEVVGKKKSIEIHGDINAPICDSVVSNLDTRIFFLNVKNQKVVLEAAARITLQNLKHTESLIDGETIEEQPYVRNPCFNMICAYGAYCVSEGTTAECHCPVYDCDEKHNTSAQFPLCGSDGTTYPSDCHLKEAQCQSQLKIRTVPMKQCDSTVDDDSLCDDVQCADNRQCTVVDTDNGMSSRAICTCLRCDDVTMEPVCGSDGVTYYSLCHLKRKSCIVGDDDLVAVRSSKCNPCEVYNRMSGDFESSCSQCTVDDEGPVCCEDIQCEEDSTQVVCADDGNTYNTECAMKKRACRTGRTLSVIYKGACPDRKDFTTVRGAIAFDMVTREGNQGSAFIYSLEESVNRILMEENEIDIDGKILKEFMVYDSRDDGILYQAEMSLVDSPLGEDDLPTEDHQWAFERLHNTDTGAINLFARQHQLNFEVGRNPVDDFLVEDVCLTTQCTNGARCYLKRIDNFWKADEYVPDCRCTDNKQELVADYAGCKRASDGVNDTIMVENHEDVRAVVCRTGTALTVKDICKAETCETSELSCNFGSQCEIQDGTPTCSCNHLQCEELPSDPVCASDGLTYDTFCHMKQSSCTKQMLITVAAKGRCDDFIEMEGSGDEDDDDDDDDFEGSGCDCEFGASCQSNTLIDDEDEECVCQFDCKAQMSPVCGSNGVTYTSECHLLETQCNLQVAISVVEHTTCKAFCDCNDLGSETTRRCNISSDGEGQCECKVNVGGSKCDACLPGYWNFKALARYFDVPQGCEECGCNVHGSTRDDCEQEEGKCECIEGVTGRQCDTCEHDGSTVTETKCQHPPVEVNIKSGSVSKPESSWWSKLLWGDDEEEEVVPAPRALPVEASTTTTTELTTTTTTTADVTTAAETTAEEETTAVSSEPTTVVEVQTVAPFVTTPPSTVVDETTAAVTTTTVQVTTADIDDGDLETSGDVECEFGDDENCNFPQSSSGDGASEEDSTQATEPANLLASSSSASTTTVLTSEQHSSTAQLPNVFFSGKVTFSKDNKYEMSYSDALSDIESELYSTYSHNISEKIKQVNNLNEAWNITMVTVTSFSEKKGWWSWNKPAQLVAQFDIELVAYSSMLPTNQEVAFELNQLDSDDMEFELNESGTLQ